jgi:hypothetical protein
MTDLSNDRDNLIPFFDLVASNQKGSIRTFPEQHELLRRVNVCLSTAWLKQPRISSVAACR